MAVTVRLDCTYPIQSDGLNLARLHGKATFSVDGDKAELLSVELEGTRWAQLEGRWVQVLELVPVQRDFPYRKRLFRYVTDHCAFYAIAKARIASV